MANILNVNHKTSDGQYHELSFNLDVIQIHSISEHPLSEFRSIYWHVAGIDEENCTHVADSYASLKERIWGIKDE